MAQPEAPHTRGFLFADLRGYTQFVETHGDKAANVVALKAVVTQASSAIPVVPLYISLLYKVMKPRGLHEGCIEQIQRLFADRLAPAADPQLDEQGRIRIDDWEMKPEVQEAVAKVWSVVTTENLPAVSDIAGYRAEFLQLFGFGLPGVNYEAETDPNVPVPSIG